VQDSLTIGIAGSGGDGVVLLGELLARAGARVGWHTMLQKSFGPQIRGGESSVRIRVGPAPLTWAGDSVDALLLFSWEGLARFRSELTLAPGALIIVDSLDSTPLDEAPIPADLRPKVRAAPFDELALAHGKTKQAKNMVMAGLICEVFGWPADGLEGYIRERFSRYAARVVDSNLSAVRAGREYAREHFAGAPAPRADYPRGEPLYFISGDEAFGLGALHGGCRFMAGYPISPASELLEWLARELPQVGGHCLQAEDEIAATCMAIGASYGGARAMTATSGPGLTLMQEAVGFATMAEVPLVVCDVQRCGPSTGIPTRTEQGDLLAAIHGGHGDEQRCVLAATDVADCYEMAHHAFEIAERYQMPVVVLMDQYLGQNWQSIAQPNWRVLDAPGAQASALGSEESPPGTLKQPGYQRYSLASPDGVSPRTLPGTPGGEHIAAGIEQTPSGEVSSSPANHQAMSAKRAAKLAAAGAAFLLVARWDAPGVAGAMPAGGSPGSSGSTRRPLGLLTWGSTYGVCVEAAHLLCEAGTPTRVLAPRMLNPLPLDLLREWLDGCGDVAVVELNYSGQLLAHLRAHLPELATHPALRAYHRAGGVPIRLGELLDWLRG
jgi:2-oxoglutarate/2-oxoacid ferredoxin oxidoreductase subunit alpha